MLSLKPLSYTSKDYDALLDTYAHRVEAMPPGTCPVVISEQLLRLSAAQTCGKCVPCRDGLPYLADIAGDLAACRADAATLEKARETARLIAASADCAIGAEAARTFLENLGAFADEYASHVENGTCTQDMHQTVPCETLCPAHVNVPGYISCIAAGRPEDAIRIIRQDNPFPTVCAYVCEHPCESRCRRSLVDAPLNIRGLKKFAVDACPADTVPLPAAEVSSGRKIAIVGGSASGLTCAYYLALMGHSVTIFEGGEQLGGMLQYGIPRYRLPQEKLEQDIRAILSAGDITVEYGRYIDADDMIEITRSFDAVYVAIGAHAGKRLPCENADAAGVFSAVEVLRNAGLGNPPDYHGKNVVVVGGGNVAMDCARTAVRSGAAGVAVVYRRRREDMTALPEEVDGAIAEGVELVTLEAPIMVETDENGHCTALLTQPQIIGPVRAGRPAPRNAQAPCRRLPADIILSAVGQNIVSAPFEAFGLTVAQGRLSADEHLETAVAKVFTGGDCQTGPASAIRAIAAGKVAAINIDRYLGYRHTLKDDVEIPHAETDPTHMGRVNVNERPVAQRVRDFQGVELAMSWEEAQQECSRCLHCDRNGVGVVTGGRMKHA